MTTIYPIIAAIVEAKDAEIARLREAVRLALEGDEESGYRSLAHWAQLLVVYGHPTHPKAERTTEQFRALEARIKALAGLS
jgi:acetylornithine deacetylase/succinyl-diaminopimelate desuccinylase-like protein